MHSSDTFSRRRALATLAAGAAAAGLAPGAHAATTDEAVSLVNRIVEDLTQIVRSSTSEAEALRQFEQMFNRYGDVPIIARSVLGQPWNQMSQSQRQAFVDAFRGYITRKYGSQFREYRDAQVTVTGARDFGEKGVVVSTRVKYGNEAPFTVDWQVSDRSGEPKMFNLLIEGVSMLSSERSEVRALLAQNGNNVDALIADLRNRAS